MKNNFVNLFTRVVIITQYTDKILGIMITSEYINRKARNLNLLLDLGHNFDQFYFKLTL